MLHIRTVLLEPTVGQMIDTLTKLPENLEAAFKKTMLRIQDQSDHRRQLALICLTWIVYARRPLTFKELSDALAMTTKPELTAVNDTYKTFRPPLKMLIDCCHGLIAIDEESMVVRLAHYSIHEYLCRCQPPLLPDGEKTLADLCITYQMLEPFSFGCCHKAAELVQLMDDCPFVAYAACHWVCLGASSRRSLS